MSLLHQQYNNPKQAFSSKQTKRTDEGRGLLIFLEIVRKCFFYDGVEGLVVFNTKMFQFLLQGRVKAHNGGLLNGNPVTFRKSISLCHA